MHIPDNYLSPSSCAVMTAAVIPAWVHSVKKLKAELPKEKMVLLGVGAAFSFLGMMFNIPLPGGTTGHAVGGTLIALLLGPEAACIAVTIALLIQALLFGDGGILAFGANCFNMAFALPYVGYYSCLLFRRLFGVSNSIAGAGAGLSVQSGAGASAGVLGRSGSGAGALPPLDEDALRSAKRKDRIAVGLGAYLGINAAALLTAIEFGIQPMLFKAADGTPLYCPYGLELSIPAMMLGHLTIFGLAEVIFTVAIYTFLGASSADYFYNGSFAGAAAGSSSRSAAAASAGTASTAETGTAGTAKAGFGSRRASILLGILILATPLGLLAAGTAWGEWEISEMPTMKESFSWNSIMPDYTISGLPEAAAYILSAVIGVTIVILLFRVIAALMKSKTEY